jgi:hypothetical protein
MTASGPRDVLWLHAERGDRQKQRQQANDRHEEVQRFFHSVGLTHYQPGLTQIGTIISILFSPRASGKRGKSSFSHRIFCGLARIEIMRWGVSKDFQRRRSRCQR